MAKKASKKITSEKKKRGRPSILNDTLKSQILKMYELRITDEQVAGIVGVSPATVDNWKKDQNFLGSIKEAKELADDLIESSLMARASGYSHKVIKTSIDRNGKKVITEYDEHYPPDPTSMIFWLKNRKPKEWRDKQEIDSTVKSIQINIDADDEKL